MLLKASNTSLQSENIIRWIHNRYEHKATWNFQWGNFWLPHKPSQLKKPLFLFPKKMTCSPKYEEPSRCFCNVHGVVHYKFHPQGQILNKHYYNDTLWDQQQHVWKKQNESGILGIGVCTTTMQLLTLLCLSQFLTKNKMSFHTTLTHHVEQQVPSFLLFTKLKMALNLSSRDLQSPCWPQFFIFILNVHIYAC